MAPRRCLPRPVRLRRRDHLRRRAHLYRLLRPRFLLLPKLLPRPKKRRHLTRRQNHWQVSRRRCRNPRQRCSRCRPLAPLRRYPNRCLNCPRCRLLA